MLVDEHAAGPAELGPDREQCAVLIKDLDAVITAISYEQPPPAVHGQRMGRFQLTGSAAMPAPLLDEFPVGAEFDYARIALPGLMPVRHENIAVGRHHHGIGLVKG